MIVYAWILFIFVALGLLGGMFSLDEDYFIVNIYNIVCNAFKVIYFIIFLFVLNAHIVWMLQVMLIITSFGFIINLIAKMPFISLFNIAEIIFYVLVLFF